MFSKTNAMPEVKEDEGTPLLQSSKDLPKKRLVTVEPLAFFFAASIGVFGAMEPQYIEERLAQDLQTTISSLYGLGPPFCWSSVTLGYFNVVSMVFGAIGLLVGSKLFSLCLEDYWILQIAYLFGGLSNLFLAWAPTTPMFFLGAVLGCPKGMEAPVLNSIISKLVSPHEQGTIFAVQSSVQSAASLISPLILNSIYSASVKTQPSLVFYVIAGVFFMLIILTWLWVIYTRKAVKLTTTRDNMS
ncbi:proton-coupled folate transporter-like isoform X3 [Amphiura filiformis]|uniref:proton-coupled folate transporter-like isoform X3 n=1 Tax=Amphiura filiformis TaxID=82378 RepID=UPI003B215520